MPLSPSQTRALLDELGHRPRKPLGQNFLIDGNIVRKSLQLAGLQPGENVVEVGPGLGTLSSALLETGCRVHAVELDATLAAYLRDSLGNEFPEKFHLLEGDAVQHPRAGFLATGPGFKVVANLPYAITSPWLDAILAHPLPGNMVLMMQKEAADRITAAPGSKSYGAISIFTGAAYEKAGVHKVSRNCFYPVPGVDSQLLHLRRKAEPVLFSGNVRVLIRQLFTQRRKQIGSLLPKEERLQAWLKALPEYGCARTDRPEDIPLPAWLALNASLS